MKPLLTSLIVVIAGLFLYAMELPAEPQQKSKHGVSPAVKKSANGKTRSAKDSKTRNRKKEAAALDPTQPRKSLPARSSRVNTAGTSAKKRKPSTNKPAMQSTNGASNRSGRTGQEKNAITKGKNAITKGKRNAEDRNSVKTTAVRKAHRESNESQSVGRGGNTLPRSSNIRLKQEELERIKKEIRTYEQRLNESKKAERSTLDRIDTYSKQTSLIRMVLSDLNMRITGNKQQIDDAVVRLKRAERDLKHLQDGYARSIVNAYKRGRTHDTELLLSSTSLNQMFIRSKYLRAFSSRQRREADRIRETRQAVEQQKTALESKVQEQQQTVVEKKGEEKTLQRNLDQSRDLLDKVRKDKESYRAELQRKQSAAAKIERLIADLIERERMKRLAASAKKDRSLTDADKNTSTRRLGGKIVELPGKPISETAFGRLKGRLPWPVTHGAVVGGFGEQVHPKLGTVTISNGIDIQVESGTPVRAVADGIVSMTYFIAGYGNLIILNHDDGFFTVYAHLSDINVRQGMRVKAGQSLARSAESLSGSQIHFELWRERAKQNPLLWLSHR